MCRFLASEGARHTNGSEIGVGRILVWPTVEDDLRNSESGPFPAICLFYNIFPVYAGA